LPDEKASEMTRSEWIASIALEMDSEISQLRQELKRMRQEFDILKEGSLLEIKTLVESIHKNYPNMKEEAAKEIAENLELVRHRYNL